MADDAVTVERIVEAILKGEPLDFSYKVLGTEQTNPPLYCPPVLKAFAEEEPEDRHSEAYLTLEQFEALSLAARGRLLGLTKFDGSSPWLRNFQDMVQVHATDLRDAIIIAAQIARRGAHQERAGLHVIGAYIDDDLDIAHLDLPFSVRLISCAVDGAIRAGRTRVVTLDLSGSIVRGVFGSFLQTSGSVRMRRVMSTSVVDFGGAKVDDVFDASDAVVFPLDDPPGQEAFVGDRGIFNLSLARLGNEARMMRARIYGGLTLKGCRIERSFFLDDAVLRSPLAFLERLGTDVVNRFGGQNMLVRLPLAVQTSWRPEQKLAEELHEVIKDDGERDLRVRFETLFDFVMPAQIGERIQADADGRPTRRRGGRLLQRLLTESPRARSACLRADGMVVAGTIFARSIKSSGRLRFNYMRISHSLQLDGARLRSSEDIAEGLAAILRVLEGVDVEQLSWPGFVDFANDKLLYRADDLRSGDEPRRTARRSSVKRERAENEAYALDMRDVEIGGGVGLKPDNRGGKKHAYDERLGERVTALMSLPCRCKELERCMCGRRKCVCDRVKPRCQCEQLRKHWSLRLKNNHPETHCVYVNGQIALGGATIGGDLDLTGVLANLHNADERFERSTKYEPEKAFIQMRQCQVGGDFRLIDSMGVHGITGHHAKIGARIRFAVGRPADDKIERPALLLSGVIALPDAQIGGDATFLFDGDVGPSLRMARARVGGRLHVLPANALSIASDRKVFARRRLTKLREGRIPTDVPEVDLRFVTAAEIGHPDTAWPRPDFLKIEGLVYEQSWIYGPLTAPARTHERELVKTRESASATEPAVSSKAPADETSGGFVEERHGPEEVPDTPAEFELIWMVLVAVGFLMACLVAASWDAGWVRWVDIKVGIANALVLASVVLGYCVQWLIARLSNPKRSDGQPRAIYWLGLQRASASVYRQKGMTIPLQPYVQAGKVLRSAGLILSANLLEVDRLVRRNEQLSWRNNWPAKMLLNVANFATRYGFDPLRTIVIAVVIGALAAIAFHMADRGGFVRPVDAELLQLAQQHDEPMLLGFACDAEAAGCAARPNPNYPSFSSLLYALDVMTPGLDIGQERYWRASQSSVAQPNKKVLLLDLAAPFLKILGWLLTTAIAISLLTRVEAMIARHEE